MSDLDEFVEAITETRQVWLLQAMEGMFAMLEDAEGHSYIPIWDTEEKAFQAAAGDWTGYTVTEMGFTELYGWLRELKRDEIDLAVSPEKEGKITAITSGDFRRFVKQYIDSSYKEDVDDTEESEYGEDWAEEWQ